MKNFIPFIIFALACQENPVALPEQNCTSMILDFSSGYVDQYGDYNQEVVSENIRFIFQWIYDPDIIAVLDSGRVVWKTEEVYFQWFSKIQGEPYHFFQDFRSIELTADGPIHLTFVGDDFDTLTVATTLDSQPWVLMISDSLFKNTTQVHAFGIVPLGPGGRGLRVDNVDICLIPN